MKITKARLKEIIREEMDKLVATGEITVDEGAALLANPLDLLDEGGPDDIEDAEKKKKAATTS
tara:strand:- start:833 stop:1021 length:189 start_codon:yes stop_codon:yes gene_type:complete